MPAPPKRNCFPQSWTGDVMATEPLAVPRRRAPFSETPPPSQGGPPFTLDEIDESIRLMERRLETGQGTRASAMCRLSLDATKALRGMLETAESNYRFMVERAADENLDGYRELGKRAADAETEAERLRAEVARLLQRTWDEHQFDGKPACTCHDCRTYARNSGLWDEVTDGSGRVVDFKPAKQETRNG